MRKSKSIVGITNQYPLGMHVDLQQQLYDLIHPFAADKILLDATDVPSWKSDIDLEKESVREPTASKVTKYLSEKSKKRSEIVSLLFQEVRLASKSPIDTRSAAGHRLRIVTDTYKGLQNENMNDATGHIAGLLLDLEKTDEAADLATIGMTPLVQMLRTINSEFITLRDERLKSEALIGVVKGSTLRAKNDEAANEIFKHIEAAYLSTSSDDDRKAIGELIDRINRVIQHTTTSYRRSLAQKKVSADRKKTPKQPNDPKQPKEPKKKRKESDPDIRLPEEEPKKPDNGGDGKKPGEDKKPTPGGGGSGSGGGTGGDGDPDIHLPEE